MATEDTCPICYEPLKDQRQLQTRCSHAFHTDCLLEWVAAGSGGRQRCPTCRGSFIGTSGIGEISSSTRAVRSGAAVAAAAAAAEVRDILATRAMTQQSIENAHGWRLWSTSLGRLDTHRELHFKVRAPDGRLAIGSTREVNDTQQIEPFLRAIESMLVRIPRVSIRRRYRRTILLSVAGRATERSRVFRMADETPGRVVHGQFLYGVFDPRKDLVTRAVEAAPAFFLTWLHEYEAFSNEEGMRAWCFGSYGRPASRHESVNII